MPEYAVVVPTFNEAGNVRKLVEKLEETLRGLDWEVIFVDDDSKDGTLSELHDMAKNKPHVRYVRRLGRRGLASACVEGMMATSADFIAVMDADLQHDETRLTELFKVLTSGQANLAVASRYTGHGGTGEWDKRRVGMSRLATRIAQKVLATPSTDPMSGFFALTRDIAQKAAPRLQSRGFKILFDLLTMPELGITVREVPYIFKERVCGSTKLNSAVLIDFLWLFLSKYVNKFIHVQFAMFCLVGLSGVAVHVASLAFFHKMLGFSFTMGQSLATLLAMSSNYLLNNLITFSEQRLRGTALVLGYFKFAFACALGAFCNVVIADQLQSHGMHWLVAGCAGVGVGAIINYFFARFVVWAS